MSVHDAFHHFLVDGERDVDFGTLYHGGPVLVAYGVTELDAGLYDFKLIFFFDRRKVDDKHRTQFDACHDGRVGVGVIFKDIAFNELCVALQRHCTLCAFVACNYESAFLGCPLIEVEVFDRCFFNLFGKILVTVDVAYYFAEYLHVGYK